MNRHDYMYLQSVTEAELDGSFDECENADRNMWGDAAFWGVYNGVTVSEKSPTPNISVDVSSGVAYDRDGNRIYVGTSTNVDCSIDSQGVSTAVATPGHNRYLSIFLKFNRTLSDPRTDGYGSTVYFVRAESFEIWVKQGTSAALPAKPALETDSVLLADVLLQYGDTELEDADVSTTRREWQINSSSGSTSIQYGTLKEAMDQIATLIDDQSSAANISYAGGPDWASGGSNPATTVKGQLDKIITDLAGTTPLHGGTRDIGGDAVSGSPLALSSGMLRSQLDTLLGGVNARGLLAGGNTWSDNQTFNGTVLTFSGSVLLNGGATVTTISATTKIVTNVLEQRSAGYIQASSELRMGNDFSFILPVGSTGKIETDELDTDKIRARGAGTEIVVDDDLDGAGKMFVATTHRCTNLEVLTIKGGSGGGSTVNVDDVIQFDEKSITEHDVMKYRSTISTTSNEAVDPSIGVVDIKYTNSAGVTVTISVSGDDVEFGGIYWFVVKSNLSSGTQQVSFVGTASLGVGGETTFSWTDTGNYCVVFKGMCVKDYSGSKLLMVHHWEQ